KLKKMADIGIDMTVAGIRSPAIGDAGAIGGAGKIAWSGTIQGPAFMHYGDPRFAKVLKLMGAQSETLWDNEFDPEKVDAVVAKEGTDLSYKTRNIGGYGLAILESGQGANRRGLSMYYGHAGGGHGHADRLTIELQDSRFKTPVLSDMGYPAHWNTKCTYWTTNTISHYDVVVNQSRQQTMYAGALNTLASAPGLQLADASADKVAYPSAASLYRRTVALIDLSPESSYVLDVFRVKGGWEHDYSFHGPAFPEFTVAGGEPGPVQKQGTLAGEDVAFGEKPNPASTGAVTYVLRTGEGVLDDKRDYGARSLDGWSTYYSGPEALCRKEGAVMSLKAALPAGKYKLYLRAYDYNAGTNVVDIAAGGRTQSFKWEPSGQVGYRWVAQVYDFAQPVDKITLTAKQIGQSYVLLEGLTATTDIEGVEPRVWDPATSGFQYLYNVRRMKPAGAWSATWRDPETKLALTTTMPEQAAAEIILADAEPELQPGAPESLQYFLARNTSEGDDLQSAFVTISEPHAGAALIQSVKRLATEQSEPGTIGLSVALEHGRDLIHSSLNPGEPVTWQDGKLALNVAGEFALLRLDGEGVRAAYLVNGTRLQYGDFAIKAQPSPAGQVLAVDYAHNSITVDAALSSPEAYTDRVAILGNDRHQTSYTIRQAVAKDGKTELRFGDVLYLVGMGKVTEVDQKAGTVKTDTTLTGYGRVDGGQHQGRWLYNEDKSQGFRIAAFSGSVFKLERV
ncbi:MAG: heparinase II/III family protein, partial [Armatimonadetes bacterium]|nr:heparinase II/III family protein [Armatimonadota bacterium]